MFLCSFGNKTLFKHSVADCSPKMTTTVSPILHSFCNDTLLSGGASISVSLNPRWQKWHCVVLRLASKMQCCFCFFALWKSQLPCNKEARDKILSAEVASMCSERGHVGELNMCYVSETSWTFQVKLATIRPQLHGHHFWNRRTSQPGPSWIYDPQNF